MNFNYQHLQDFLIKTGQNVQEHYYLSHTFLTFDMC